jgi:hypothetical protein
VTPGRGQLLALSLVALGVARNAAADVQAGGEHARLATPQGVVHVWKPGDYRPQSAGIVIYVHGYFADADSVWQQHALAEQFAESRENALFVVPEAPRSDRWPVSWTSLDPLLAAVESVTPLPKGPLVVVGHSGAFRTILCWLGDKRLSHLILLDGLYGRELPFHAWLRGGRGPSPRQLVMVASETMPKAEHFASRYRSAARLPEVPAQVSQIPEQKRKAPVLYMRSQYEHNEIVTSGRVIPLLLQLMPLPLLY